MAMNLRFLRIFLLTIIAFPTFAQQATLTGSVLDASSQAPLEYANIVLYRSADSTLLDGVVTQTDGTFTLEKIAAGAYYLQIQFVGYEPQQIKNIRMSGRQQQAVGAIALSGNEQLLEEIQVTGDPAATYHKIDRQVYNVAQFQSATGGTATDVLRNVPSVVVTPQGGITVRGSTGFTILLNGKPIQSDPTAILKPTARQRD